MSEHETNARKLLEAAVENRRQFIERVVKGMSEGMKASPNEFDKIAALQATVEAARRACEDEKAMRAKRTIADSL